MLIPGALCALYLMILLLKAGLALRVLRQPQRDNPLKQSVTIVQPILSGDPALSAVLESNVSSLSGAAFCWLVDEDDGEAQQICRDLRQRYPAVAIDIQLYPQAAEGINPKLFKLEQAWRSVSTEVCLVLDDDSQLAGQDFHDLVASCQPGKIVTGLPHYRAAHDLPSRLLAQFVNDNALMTYLPLLPFSPPLTLNGMCYALHKETLARLGGFAPILHHLTDDLALADLARRHQVAIVQHTATVRVQTSLRDLRHYAQQMHRWNLFATLLLREKSAGIKLIIFLLQGLHPLLLWGILIGMLSGSPAALISGTACLLVRQGTLCWLLRGRGGSHPFLSLLSELLQPLHLLHALCRRSIRWRSRRYRVFSNDRFISR